MKIKEVLEPKGKQEITRAVLEALPDWFGVEESREEYIKISADLIFYAAFDKEKPVGFICLKETGKDTAEICVMGVLKEYHHMGIGKALGGILSDKFGMRKVAIISTLLAVPFLCFGDNIMIVSLIGVMMFYR